MYHLKSALAAARGQLKIERDSVHGIECTLGLSYHLLFYTYFLYIIYYSSLILVSDVL